MKQIQIKYQENYLLKYIKFIFPIFFIFSCELIKIEETQNKLINSLNTIANREHSFDDTISGVVIVSIAEHNNVSFHFNARNNSYSNDTIKIKFSMNSINGFSLNMHLEEFDISVLVNETNILFKNNDDTIKEYKIDNIGGNNYIEWPKEIESYKLFYDCIMLHISPLTEGWMETDIAFKAVLEHTQIHRFNEISTETDIHAQFTDTKISGFQWEFLIGNINDYIILRRKTLKSKNDIIIYDYRYKEYELAYVENGFIFPKTIESLGTVVKDYTSKINSINLKPKSITSSVGLN